VPTLVSLELAQLLLGRLAQPQISLAVNN